MFIAFILTFIASRAASERPKLDASTSTKLIPSQDALQILISDEDEELSIKMRQTTHPLQKLLTRIFEQPAKRQAIVDIGFGGLLHMNFPRNDPVICAQIVNLYGENSCSLLIEWGQSLKVEEVDVHNVYGLPRVGPSIKESKVGDAYWGMLDEWRAYLGVDKDKFHNYSTVNYGEQAGFFLPMLR